jgi:N-methylhydantoinase A
MEDPIEITTLRLRATGSVDKPSLPLLPKRVTGHPKAHGRRAVYLSPDRPAVDYALFLREELLAGDVITGPAVIAEHTATTVMHAGEVLRVGRHGEMVLKVSTRPEEAWR